MIKSLTMRGRADRSGSSREVRQVGVAATQRHTGSEAVMIWKHARSGRQLDEGATI
jgi:hypothetical protein